MLNLKQAKEQIYFQVLPLKLVYNYLCVYSFVGYRQNFQMPCPTKADNCIQKVIFWNWGPTTIWNNLATPNFFFFKNHPTLMHNPLLHYSMNSLNLSQNKILIILYLCSLSSPLLNKCSSWNILWSNMNKYFLWLRGIWLL